MTTALLFEGMCWPVLTCVCSPDSYDVIPELDPWHHRRAHRPVRGAGRGAGRVPALQQPDRPHRHRHLRSRSVTSGIAAWCSGRVVWMWTIIALIYLCLVFSVVRIWHHHSWSTVEPPVPDPVSRHPGPNTPGDRYWLWTSTQQWHKPVLLWHGDWMNDASFRVVIGTTE